LSVSPDGRWPEAIRPFVWFVTASIALINGICREAICRGRQGRERFARHVGSVAAPYPMFRIRSRCRQ
jgi:hypothetical protein